MSRFPILRCPSAVRRTATLCLYLSVWFTHGRHVSAQTIDDGVMLPKHAVLVADIYSHDAWNEYWEGGLKRVNGNIGTITTQTNGWFANYGVSDRLNVLATVPRVWTQASQGVLHGVAGYQDFAVAAKYAFADRKATPVGAFRAIAVAAASLPMTEYTPDFYPLSIGSASKRLSGRGTVDVQSNGGWYVTGSAEYVWRADVTLDRPYYYTNGQLFLTDQVDMPEVFDYTAYAGYRARRLMAAFSWLQQRTLGGGDIRRQDMPFVSNRMNLSRVGGVAMVPIPKMPNIVADLAYAFTVSGRNVGQATTFTAGVMYRLPFGGRAE